MDSLRKLKVAELKAELEARGRSTAGLKADLVERLARVVASGEDAAADRSPAAEPAGDSPAVQRTMFNSRPASSSSASDAIVVDGDTNFSGMEVVFLGTSSGSPSFTRNVSSYALRLTDEIWLFDCGEATQHQLMRSKLRYTKITRIFITHMHGDHIFGLPGLICALSGARAELRRVHGKDPTPLYITGPPGICDYVRAAITCSRTVLGLPLIVTELVAPGNGARGQARFFFVTPVPIRPRSRCELHSLRTFSPGVRFSPRTPRFQSRHTSTPFDSIHLTPFNSTPTSSL